MFLLVHTGKWIFRTGIDEKGPSIEIRRSTNKMSIIIKTRRSHDRLIFMVGILSLDITYLHWAEVQTMIAKVYTRRQASVS